MNTIEKKYYVVNTVETINLLLQHINEHEILALDTETSGLNTRRARVVGFSLCGEEGLSFYMPTLVWDSEGECFKEQTIGGKGAEGIARKVLSMLKGKKLIFHNGSFDCQVIRNYYGIDLIEDIWVDTIMLVHTVNEEGAFGYGNPFGLKSIAIMNQEALGLNVEEAANQEQIELKESIKKNGGSITKDNFEIYKADLEILARYAAADTDLTFRICNLYLPILKQEGLEKFFFEEEVMPIYKEVTIPMEAYGVDLDMDLLHKTNENILKDLEENKKIVMKSILAIPEAQSWALDTAFKNFPPSNKGSWAQKLCERYSLPLPRSEKSGKYSITSKSIEALDDSPVKEFLKIGDYKVLDELEVARISMAMWKESNDNEFINIQSKKHLGEIIFKYMKIKPLTKTDKGTDQFDMDMIEHLAKKHPWAENLRIYNKLLKIKSTYVDRFLEGAQEGRYYFYYKQNGTVSGRYGSDAQQLPKPKEEGEDAPIIVKYNNIVREFLIAGKGRKIIDSDYNSLEPCCFSSITEDQGLRDIFRNGWDFYSTIAIRTEKLDQDTRTYPDGVSPDKKASNFLKKIDPVKRNKAKAYSLGIPYGMSSYALSKTLDISEKEAAKLVDGYLDGFPGLRRWIEASRKQVKEHGFISNKVGRIRHLPEAKEIYTAFEDKLMDWRFRRELEAQYGKDRVTNLYRDYKNAMNSCLNYQLQSLAASIVNRAALHINRKAREMGIDAAVQCQVHDQLIINVREDQAEMFAPIVQHIMENNYKLDGVDLKAPPEIGDNWHETH